MRNIEVNGTTMPIDFSIMTVLEVCDKYGTDPTGLSQLFAGFKTLREQMQFVIDVAVIALNDGARREHLSNSVTEFDVREMLTKDVSLSEEIIHGLFDTFKSEEVFTKPPREATKSKKSAK